MIRIAACGHIQLQGNDIAGALEACARNRGSVEYSLDQLETPVDLIESATESLAQLPYQLVICAIDLAGVSGVHAMSELSDVYSHADELRVVLCSADTGHAYLAQQIGAAGFLVEPVSQADFDRVVGRQLQQIEKLNSQSVVVRCRDRVRRIYFNRLSYVETSGHDQVLHHIRGGASCEMRGSSRDLYAMLEADGRFFKLGSSYIVNLDLVESFDSKNGLAVLFDGTQIPAPVRVRKAFEQALIGRGHVVA